MECQDEAIIRYLVEAGCNLFVGKYRPEYEYRDVPFKHVIQHCLDKQNTQLLKDVIPKVKNDTEVAKALLFNMNEIFVEVLTSLKPKIDGRLQQLFINSLNTEAYKNLNKG